MSVEEEGEGRVWRGHEEVYGSSVRTGSSIKMSVKVDDETVRRDQSFDCDVVTGLEGIGIETEILSFSDQSS